MGLSLRRLVLFAAVVSFTGEASAGAVLRVGPQRPFATIQQAVDAATEGDLILVDPGRYAPFEVLGKSVAILGADPRQRFTMIPDRTRPVVRVRFLARHQSVTVRDWQTDVTFGDAPVLEVAWCRGCVRIEDAGLALGHLGSVQVAAPVEIVSSASVSCSGVDVWSDQPRNGRRAQGIATLVGIDRGLSAIRASDSVLYLHDCKLRGYDNSPASAAGQWGGDALRLLGRSRGRVSGARTQFIGGTGGEFGGSAIHHLGTIQAPDAAACGVSFSSFVPGAGPKPGGVLAHDHDRGQAGPTWQRIVPACLFSSFGVVRAPARIPINRTSTIEVESFFPRSFVLAVGPTRVGSLPGIENPLHIDLAAPWTTILATGALTTAGARVAVVVPDLPALAGLQLSLQAALGPPLGRNVPAVSLSLPQTVVVTS